MFIRSRPVPAAKDIGREQLVARPPRPRLERQARAIHQRRLLDVVFEQRVDLIVRKLDAGLHDRGRRRSAIARRLAQDSRRAAPSSWPPAASSPARLLASIADTGRPPSARGSRCKSPGRARRSTQSFVGEGHDCSAAISGQREVASSSSSSRRFMASPCGAEKPPSVRRRPARDGRARRADNDSWPSPGRPRGPHPANRTRRPTRRSFASGRAGIRRQACTMRRPKWRQMPLVDSRRRRSRQRRPPHTRSSRSIDVGESIAAVRRHRRTSIDRRPHRRRSK